MAVLKPLLRPVQVVREASRRVLGLRPFDVQLIGGMVLHDGKIAEMRTGEGKTLVSVLPAYLNALSGKGVHVRLSAAVCGHACVPGGSPRLCWNVAVRVTKVQRVWTLDALRLLMWRCQGFPRAGRPCCAQKGSLMSLLTGVVCISPAFALTRDEDPPPPPPPPPPRPPRAGRPGRLTAQCMRRWSR